MQKNERIEIGVPKHIVTMQNIHNDRLKQICVQQQEDVTAARRWWCRFLCEAFDHHVMYEFLVFHRKCNMCLLLCRQSVFWCSDLSCLICTLKQIMSYCTPLHSSSSVSPIQSYEIGMTIIVSIAIIHKKIIVLTLTWVCLKWRFYIIGFLSTLTVFITTSTLTSELDQKLDWNKVVRSIDRPSNFISIQFLTSGFSITRRPQIEF